MRNLVLMGPPGSGKSTQARLLADDSDTSLLNVGDLLYFASQEENKIGKEIKNTMELGKLVDEDLTTKLVQDHLKQKEHSSGVIIDGFPRSLKQAKDFKHDLDRVIYLEVSDKVNIKRLAKRGRKDDTPEIIKKRLEVYHKVTEPILEYYKEKEILVKINGEQTEEKIFEEIKDMLAKL